jgi:hypothetical protein
MTEKLKTLKDLEYCNDLDKDIGGICNPSELRGEARKWLERMKKNRDKRSKRTHAYPWFAGQVEFIERFFDLEEEE